jgi:hypothetical protein
MSHLTGLRLAVAATLIAACTSAVMIASQKSAATMQKAATQFLDSLSPDQKAKASFPFDGEERLRWHFIPNETFPRKGLMIKDMNEAQRRLAHDLLRSGLSARGYLRSRRSSSWKTSSRRSRPAARWRATGRVLVLGVRRAGRERPVGLARRGSSRLAPLRRRRRRRRQQHLDLTDVSRIRIRRKSVTVRRKVCAFSPTREDAARALLMALPANLQTQAIVNAVAPGDILTMNKNDITPLPEQGVAYGGMGSQQQALLTKLIEAYTSNMEADLAAERMARIKGAGIDRVRFAWLGETEKGKKHYYSVQGPTFLIEYDNTQNDGNHIHSVWRDFNGDFGRDILREHLKEVVH